MTDVPLISSTKPNLAVISKTFNFQDSLSRVAAQAGQFGFKIKDQKKRISSSPKIEEKRKNLNIKVNFSERHVSGLSLNHSRKQ